METDAKTLFHYLHQQLLEYQLRFTEMSIKGAGLLLLVLGWMLTSKPARDYVTQNTGAQVAITLAFAVIMIAYLFIAVRMSRVMQHLAKKMDELHYLPRSYYRFRVFSPRFTMVAATLMFIPAFVTVAFALFGRG